MAEYAYQLFCCVDVTAGRLYKKIRFVTLKARQDLGEVVGISMIYGLVELSKIDKKRAPCGALNVID